MSYDSRPSQLQTSEIERNSLHQFIVSLQSINSNTPCMWETVLLMTTLQATIQNTDTVFQTVRTHIIIENIANCMMDRVAANHAAIVLVNEAWHKTINELNCHLHPLDTIASSSRSALPQLETSSGKLFGKDCFAANLVVQMNKLRYKDGKDDPRRFKSFLDSEDLTRGFITRYRGDRLHVIFHIIVENT